MRQAAVLPFVLLAVAHAAAQRPMPSHGSTAATPAVARVNGVVVTGDRVTAALSTLIPQESFHRNVSSEKMAALRQQALDAVIEEELEYQDGLRRGLTASEANLQTAWDQMASRYGGSSRFADALRQAGVSKAAVQQELARRLIVEQSYTRAVLDRCQVTRDEAARFFADNPSRFVEPEQVHVHAITIGVEPSSTAAQWREARGRAEEVRLALERGVAFADAARTYSTDQSREQGGDMGFIHRGSLSAPFEEIVAALPIGAPSEVVESIYGYHVVLVSEVRAPERKTFEQVAGSLVRDLTSSRCTERKTAWIAGLRASAHIELLAPAQ